MTCRSIITGSRSSSGCAFRGGIGPFKREKTIYDKTERNPHKKENIFVAATVRDFLGKKNSRQPFHLQGRGKKGKVNIFAWGEER